MCLHLQTEEGFSAVCMLDDSITKYNGMLVKNDLGLSRISSTVSTIWSVFVHQRVPELYVVCLRHFVLVGQKLQLSVFDMVSASAYNLKKIVENVPPGSNSTVYQNGKMCTKHSFIC